jgi:homoserine O-acetyltransferase/O-succinyltransferase
VVCANILGSCYGSTGPTSINPITQQPYGRSFPPITIRDSVRLQLKMLTEYLHIQKIACVVGGSMGRWFY